MSFNPNDIQLQYQGFANTPLLWKNRKIRGLEQFEIPSDSERTVDFEILEQMRLGYRAERFVFSDLRQMPDTEILIENLQIKTKKQTIGELDCIIKHRDIPIHLELVYKLYLYDSKVGTTEIEHWIGGNRNDSFSKKLDKLRTKQLPLLYKEHTLKDLTALDIEIDDIEQRVHFRAQLYVPYKEKVQLKRLNQSCLKGFYIRPEKLRRFSNFEFFIPIKKDWLIEPQLGVNWMSYKEFKEKIDSLVTYKSYPLCWVKYPDGSIEKFFVVWWD